MNTSDKATKIQTADDLYAATDAELAEIMRKVLGAYLENRSKGGHGLSAVMPDTAGFALMFIIEKQEVRPNLRVLK